VDKMIEIGWGQACSRRPAFFGTDPDRELRERSSRRADGDWSSIGAIEPDLKRGLAIDDEPNTTALAAPVSALWESALS